MKRLYKFGVKPLFFRKKFIYPSFLPLLKEPFEKTATQKIRRFKYKESAPTVEEEKKAK